MSVTAGVSDTVIANKLRGKIGETKVKRYWPGKAPEWADDVDEDGDIRMTRAVAVKKAFPSHEDSAIGKRDDPRLRRLAESKIDNREEVRADHRREIVSTIEEENRRQERLDFEEEDEDEDALEERRKRIREKLLQRQQEEEEAALLPEEEEEEEETNSDEEQMWIVMVKPVFVPKSERDTIAERERLEEDDRALEELMKRRLEERKVETKQLVVEEIRKDEQIQRNMELEAGIADVELNEAEEYEAWKAREIARTKRDREEIEMVRNMTEEERRREWERKNPKPAAPSKQKRRFMQKYYHKGAFFQSDSDDRSSTTGSDSIFLRDFSAPTGEDKMDKSILPKVMQVKHFGRSINQH